MSIKIAITNEKGGCGKTTSAVNISAILAERGYRVLLADVIRRATQPCTTVCIMPMIRPYMTPSPVFGR